MDQVIVQEFHGKFYLTVNVDWSTGSLSHAVGEIGSKIPWLLLIGQKDFGHETKAIN